MLNWIFLLLVAGGTITAALTGRMSEASDAALAASKSAVDISFGLIGQMALWLGFMRIVQEAGLVQAIARGLRPLMRQLFPDVPSEHPAMGAMIMNMAANAAGLGNAATPFGLKAMAELETLNPRPGVATNAMALFLAINTAGLTLVPLTVIAVRASLGSHDAAGIILPSIAASLITTAVGVLASKLLQGLPWFAPERSPLLSPAPARRVSDDAGPSLPGDRPAILPGRLAVLCLVGGVLAIALSLQLVGWHIVGFEWHGLLPAPLLQQVPRLGALETLRASSAWLLPLLMAGCVLYGFGRDVRVYEVFITGAKEGFQIAVTIIPYLVAILVAFALFRAAGALDSVMAAVRPLTTPLGIPPEVLPMGLIRPFSGGGAIGVMTETMKAHGVDSLIGYMVSVMNGSTETTFYVLAVYFGSVQIRALRHTVVACLAADAAGLLSAVYFSKLFFPH